MPAHQFPFIPRRAFEYDAPRPEVQLVLTTDLGGVRVPFVIDTGAAITLIPLAFATAVRLSGERGPADDRDRPRTMAGRLDGQRGVITAALEGVTYQLPCFFYRARSRPAAGGPPLAGEAGHRTAPPPTGSVRDARARAGSEAVPPTTPVCVLGRLGFLNRVDILLARSAFYATTGTDRIAPPPPFGRGR